jgi:hypothetical protein
LRVSPAPQSEDETAGEEDRVKKRHVEISSARWGFEAQVRKGWRPAFMQASTARKVRQERMELNALSP